MSSASKRSLKAFCAVLALCGSAWAAMPVHAQAVVVRSTGPSAPAYPLGRKLPANATVTLKSGDKVTVLDKAGTRVLSGPGTFSVTTAIVREETQTATQLASLVARSGGQRVRTGAVRGEPTAPSPVPAPESVWYVDVSKGGTWCVADPAQVVLWRPNRDADGIGRLTAPDGANADVVWRAGNSLKLWPAEAAVVDGQTYSFVNPVGGTVKLTTKVLASVPADPVEVAAVLAEKGCSAQVDLLAAAGG
jgi:hypothetical protein